MTILTLLLGWLALALLVSPPLRPFLWRLPVRCQAALALGSTLGLAAIPGTVLLVGFVWHLYAMAGEGPLLHRCGRLLLSILREPWARPGLTLLLLLAAAIPFGLLRGAVSAWRSQSSSRRAIRGHPGPLVVLPSTEPIAYTVGLLRPRVVVSEGLVSSVAEEHRGVVLAHEEAHRRGRHPLLIFVAEALARGIPLAPLAWAADVLRLALEGVADERAARRLGSRELVAEAVASVALASTEAAVAFEGDEVRRVRRLLTEAPRMGWLTGATVLSGVVAVLAFSGSHAADCGRMSIAALGAVLCPMGF